MREKLSFKNSKGNQLCGILSSPASGKDKIVILCHGFSSSKESRTNVEFEEIFNEGGLATFRFDFYGHGESGGKFEDITLGEAAHDLEQAYSFLKKRGYKKFYLVGSSFGGAASVLAASRITLHSVRVSKQQFIV